MKVFMLLSLSLLGASLGCGGRSADSGRYSNGNGGSARGTGTGNNGGSGGSAGIIDSYCLPSALANTSAACVSCVESLCSTEYQAFCSGECPIDAVTPMCVATNQDIESCKQDECVEQCEPDADAGGAEMPMPSCPILSACCPSLVVSNITEENCKDTAAADYEPDCARELARDAKYCADPTLLNRAHPCVFATTGQCFIAFGVPDGQLGDSAVCLRAGGTQEKFCPTTDLLGCCSVAISGETCFYSNAGPSMSEADCTRAGGAWSSDVK